MSEFPPLTPPIDTSRAPPLYEMNEHPKRFERMSAQLVGREPGVKTVELFGIDGQRQYGIDLLAHRQASDEIEVGSCKCYQTIRASDIVKWSNDFLDHWDNYWSGRSVVRFILIVAARNITSVDVQAEIDIQTERFRSFNVEYELWGPERLTTKLQACKDITSRFLGKIWADLLCGHLDRQTSPTPPTDHAARIALTIDDLTSGFVGREYLFRRFDEFVAKNEAGYIILQAPPGEGKSAVAAQYAKTRGTFIHFNSIGEGINTPSHFSASLLEQYASAFGHDGLGAAAELEPERLIGHIFTSISARIGVRKFVIVLDALDEAQMPAGKPLSNTLFLPSHLPKNVIVIGTSRPTRLTLLTHSNQEILSLAEYSSNSRADIEAFIEQWCATPGSREHLQRLQIEKAEFNDTIADRSENNFMYVKYVLSDIKAGRWDYPDIEQLPLGLVQYYHSHWKRMGMEDRRTAATKLNVLYVLASTKKPVSAELVSKMVGQTTVAVQSVLSEWIQFLRVDMREGTRTYSLYHQSFRDFLSEEPVVVAAGLDFKAINSQIVDGLWKEIAGQYLPL
jgi:hypothetical protein